MTEAAAAGATTKQDVHTQKCTCSVVKTITPTSIHKHSCILQHSFISNYSDPKAHLLGGEILQVGLNGLQQLHKKKRRQQQPGQGELRGNSIRVELSRGHCGLRALLVLQQHNATVGGHARGHAEQQHSQALGRQLAAFNQARRQANKQAGS